MSVRHSDKRQEEDRPNGSIGLVKHMVGDMWKILVVVAAIVGSGIFVLLSRDAMLVAAILIGSGLLAFYMTYRTSRRKVRSRI